MKSNVLSFSGARSCREQYVGIRQTIGGNLRYKGMCVRARVCVYYINAHYCVSGESVYQLMLIVLQSLPVYFEANPKFKCSRKSDDAQ